MTALWLPRSYAVVTCQSQAPCAATPDKDLLKSWWTSTRDPTLKLPLLHSCQVHCDKEKLKIWGWWGIFFSGGFQILAVNGYCLWRWLGTYLKNIMFLSPKYGDSHWSHEWRYRHAGWFIITSRGDVIGRQQLLFRLVERRGDVYMSHGFIETMMLGRWCHHDITCLCGIPPPLK